MKRVLTAVAFALILCGIWVSSDSAYARAFAQEVNLTSPRLSGLKKEVEAGNRAAIESFWQDVTKQGAPLIEPFYTSTTASRHERLFPNHASGEDCS